MTPIEWIPTGETTPQNCTCHPNERPVPCQHKYAASECLASANASILPERCEIHARKMDEEGWYVTSNVLWAAAQELVRLRKIIEEHKYLLTPKTFCRSLLADKETDR